MRKILLLLLFLGSFINLFSQDCGGTPCISNPVITQDNMIFCYESALDSNSQSQCWYSNPCNQVCENSYNTYSTSYNNGSNYNWTVTGGQLITTNVLGNIITVLWGSEGIGNVSVEEIDSNGCSRTFDVCIEILAKPIASITTIPNATIVCQNTNIQFIAEDLSTSSLSHTPDSCQFPFPFDTTQYVYDLSYFWDFGDGSTSTDKEPTHTYNTAGNYTITLIISNACQCADTVTTTIQVVNTPGPEITTLCIGTVCQGDTVEYCTNAISPNWTIEGGVLYNSLNTDNCINIIWNNFDSELDDGSGSIYLSDLSSSCGMAQSIMNIPAVPINPTIQGEIKPCDNTTHKYSFTCIPGVDYYWQLISVPWGVSIIDGQGTSEITISNQWAAGSSYQIQLNISSSSLQCAFGSISLNIDVLQTLNIYGGTPVCENQIENYTSYTGQNLEWEVVNGTIQTPSVPPYIATQITVLWDQGYGTGAIKATPTSSGIFCNDFATMSVEIKETPQDPIDIINDVLGDTLICPGGTYLYTVIPSNKTSSINSSYNWTVIGGTPTQHNGDNCVITWNLTGPYSIEVINSTSSWPSCSSVPFLKQIFPLSPPPLPLISGNSTVCLNGSSLFNLLTTYPNNAIITWGVTNSNLGGVVSGQGTDTVTIEWGDQLGTTTVIVDVEICGITVTNTFMVSLIGTSVNFTTSSAIICPQSNVVFTASSSVGDFNWDFGDGNSSLQVNTPTVSHMYNQPGEYKVVLTLVDASQCTSSSSSLIVVDGPVGHINPNPIAGIIEYCDGHTITESLSVTTASNTTPALWEWYHNGSLVQTGGSTYLVSLSPPNYTEAGSYHVVLTDANGCTNSTDPLILNIINCSGGGYCTGGICGTCPNVPIPNVFNCNTNIGTWDVSFTSPNGNPADFYVFGVGAISNTTIATFTFSEAGTYHVFCKDLNGILIGHELITIPFVVDWSSFSYCDANNSNQITIHFRDTSSYLLGISGVQYLWDFGDGTTSTLQNPSHTYTVPGIYTVDFTVSYGGLTCNKTGQVDAEFNAYFSYTGPECEKTPTISFTGGGTINFTIPIISLWEWDYDDGASSGRKSPERTYIQAGNYNPSLTITNIDGCMVTVSNPLVINPKPSINSITDIIVCVNDPQIDLSTLASYSTANGEIESWSGTGVNLNAGIYYFDPLLAGGGTHELCITITDANGCIDYKCINAIVICPEKPRIFGESEYCYDYTYQQLETQNTYSSYQWFANGILQSGIWPNNSFYFGVGTYDITVSFVDDNGCSTFSDPFVLKVHDSPQAVGVSSTGICPGQQITLNHNGNQSNVDYYWNTMPQQTGSVITITAESNYEYQVIAVNQFGCETFSWNHIEIPPEVDICNVLSGCFCDSSLINSMDLIQIDGLDNYWNYSTYEWLKDGSSFVPPQTSGSLILDPSNPNYLTLIAGNISLLVTDIYGCTYESSDLVIETNCISCVSAVTDFYTNPEICDQDVLIVGNNTYSISGTYIDSLISTYGCDSIIHTNLIVFPAATSLTFDSICDFYIWNGSTYSSSGIYTYLTTNANGCDSTAALSLTINNANTGTSLVTACDIYTWDGITYTTSGAYTNTYTNTAGCDSVHTINLTINNANTGTSLVTACDIYTWDGVAYTISGAYTNTYTNAAGCDSVHTINLTINNANTGTSLVTACDTYTWNGVAYTTSGVYTNTYTNAAGCDSVHTINLTINNANTGTSLVTACDTYTWNGVAYTTSGVYTNTYINAAGCDSVHTLTLTINSSTSSITSVTSCDDYTWLVSGENYTTSGSYTDTLTNLIGCDSVLTLELNITPFSDAAFVYEQHNTCKPVISFTNTSDSYSTSYWSFGDDSFSINTNPIHTYDDPGEYLVSLVVENILGCKDSVSSYVSPINSEENLFIPNSFTPNEDELNEVFKTYADTLQNYKMWIYNRWGELLLYSDDIEQGWDGSCKGKISQYGVYLWRLQYLCGEEIRTKIGTVTLIR